MAYTAWNDGGTPGTAGSSTITTGSITDGNTVVIAFKGRSPNTPAFTHASGLNNVTLIAGPNDTGFGDDGTVNIYKATKNGTGTLTLTPSPTTMNWWRAIVVDCETDTVVDQGMIDEGLFDDTISYVSPTMPAGGGTGLGIVMSGRSDNLTLTAPTFTGLNVNAAHDQSNHRTSVAYGSLSIAASSTSTLTGSLSATGSHFDIWVLLQAGASPVSEPRRRRQIPAAIMRQRRR